MCDFSLTFPWDLSLSSNGGYQAITSRKLPWISLNPLCEDSLGRFTDSEWIHLRVWRNPPFNRWSYSPFCWIHTYPSKPEAIWDIYVDMTNWRVWHFFLKNLTRIHQSKNFILISIKKFHGVMWFVSLHHIVLFSILLLIIWFLIASDNKKAFESNANRPLAYI